MHYSPRSDSSEYLYHWVKNHERFESEKDAFHDAFRTMSVILNNGNILSGQCLGISRNHCISFTESVQNEILSDKSKYQPFGFQFRKKDIFDLGGRHAIYSPNSEVHELGPHTWRHVPFDLSTNFMNTGTGFDFSWEREWRLNRDHLSLLKCTGIIVPNDHYYDEVMKIIDCISNASAYSNEIHFGWGAPSSDVVDFCTHISDNVRILRADTTCPSLGL